MDIRPILTSLRRHKTAAILIVLEIALSCAIICNALFLINERLQRMQRPSGVAENELLHLSLHNIGDDEKIDRYAQVREDLATLRAIPGVKAAATITQVPFGHSSSNSGISLQPGQKNTTLNASSYLGGEDLLKTLGVRLVGGRDFLPDEYISSSDYNDAKAYPASIIITRAMAERLFPGRSAVGETLYIYDDKPSRVVGVIERLVRPRWMPEPGTEELSYIAPMQLRGTEYVIRTEPARRAEVMQAALAALKKLNNKRLVDEQNTLEELRNDAFRGDRAMAWLLVAVIVALLVVTALGIVGLASFWVQQRTKQIGVRRALGATRGQILRYFQTENFLLATVGIVIGMIGAYGINQLLMGEYELPRLPALYLPVGALVLWALGQLSVLGPARRAAAVPPAVATRTV